MDAPRRTVRLLVAEDEILELAAAKSGESVSAILARGGVSEAKRILGVE